MKRLRNFIDKLRQPKKISASDPGNFVEIWSFNATGIQLISFVLLICLFSGILFSWLIIKGPFSSYFSKNDVSIERKKLEDQHKEIIELIGRIEEQEKYINDIKTILRGETVKDTLTSDFPEIHQISSSELNPEPTENEDKLSGKVKDDLRTNTKKKRSGAYEYFVSPVKGHVSQEFNLISHPGIDIVTAKNENVKACLSGTVIYSGYTLKDGFVLLLDHANGYVSVYKHNKTVLKNVGTKVQIGDPIAIVGNTGENSSGPHLHFELWYNQSVVNPKDYINFTKK